MNFIFKPLLVKRISEIVHKGKSQNFRRHLHRHHYKCLEMIYVDYGNITLNIDGEILNLKAGDTVFISGKYKHSFYGIEGAPFDYLNIMFRGELPEQIINKILPANRTCAEIMAVLKEESIHELPYCHDLVACKLTELIILLYRNLNTAIPNKPIEAAYRVNYNSEIINKVVNLIAQNYSEHLTLKKLSVATMVSVPTLRVLIKKETGENFTDILLKHRVNAAKYLLKEGNMSIQEIANTVGYSSTPFFFKMFKKITGMTPKEYSLSLGEPSEVV